MTGRHPAAPLRVGAALALTIALLACEEGTDPEDRPAISSITPAEALAGAQVTLTGENFGNDPGQVSIRFGQAEAAVVSVTNRRLVTNVPELPPGPVEVVVRAGGQESSPFSFTVLRPAPSITTLSPDPVRAGTTLEITGVELAGGAVRVLVADTIPLPLLDVTDARIQVGVPFGLATGRYGLRVETDGQLSNRVFSTVDVFDVSGTYALAGTVILNSCPEGPPVGSPVSRTVVVTDARPSITLDLGPAGLVQGVLEGSGAFDGAAAGGGTTFGGRFFAVDGDTAGLSGRIELRPFGSRCRILEEVTGER